MPPPAGACGGGHLPTSGEERRLRRRPPPQNWGGGSGALGPSVRRRKNSGAHLPTRWGGRWYSAPKRRPDGSSAWFGLNVPTKGHFVVYWRFVHARPLTLP